ncbi:LOW QUALITY PROTEIN: sorting nexin-32 [Molossus nigricans]
MSGTSPPLQPSSISVNLQGDSFLQVESSDAVREQDKVQFTIQTKVRLHKEARLLGVGDGLLSNKVSQLYPSFKQISPALPKPDFEASREKLQKLGEGDSSICLPKQSRSSVLELPAILCTEYLAIFKKTVAMHEVFLQRQAAHPTLWQDHIVFLEHNQDLSVGKNWKEILGSFLRNIVKSADEALITGMSVFKVTPGPALWIQPRDPNPYVSLVDNYIPLSAPLSSLGTEVNQLKKRFLKLSEFFERLRKLEGVASDQDLKLSDMLRYYMGDTVSQGER